MKIKYPKTYHLPWSEAVNDDDKIGDYSHLVGCEIVVMEKLDGENTTWYPNGAYHARSMDGTGYPWQSAMVQEVLSRLYNENGCVLRPNQRLCGENMYAAHSIRYNNLRAWFYAFSLWENEWCLSHDDLVNTGFPLPRVFYRGIFDEQILRDIASTIDTSECEGYVVRNADAFHIDDFNKNALKFVRQGHVQTDVHWTSNWTPNTKR